MKIGIVTVPYITTDDHLRFAVETLNSLTSKEHELVHIGIVNQWRESDKEVLSPYYDKVEINSINCLSKAWNMGIKTAMSFDCDYIIVPNLDIIASPNTIDKLVEFAEAHPEAYLWTASETTNKMDIEAEANEGFAESPHFSFFMLSQFWHEKLFSVESSGSEPYPGWFDEDIRPAYHEDGDMHFRMKKAEMLALRTATSMFFHYGSRTIKASEDPFQAEAQLGSGRTRDYYRAKHGGDPGQETYLTPFNK